MITVLIDEDKALDMLMDRLEYWIKNYDEDSKNIDRNLFEQMYQRSLEDGVFESVEFNPDYIVDNDYINYCQIIEPEDEEYDKINKIYQETGLCDISESTCWGFLESAYEYQGKMYYLIRY